MESYDIRLCARNIEKHRFCVYLGIRDNTVFVELTILHNNRISGQTVRYRLRNRLRGNGLHGRRPYVGCVLTQRYRVNRLGTFTHSMDTTTLEYRAQRYRDDINPIEHAWDILDRRVRRRPNLPANVNELRQALIQ